MRKHMHMTNRLRSIRTALWACLCLLPSAPILTGCDAEDDMPVSAEQEELVPLSLTADLPVSRADTDGEDSTEEPAEPTTADYLPPVPTSYTMGFFVTEAGTRTPTFEGYSNMKLGYTPGAANPWDREDLRGGRIFVRKNDSTDVFAYSPHEPGALNSDQIPFIWGKDILVSRTRTVAPKETDSIAVCPLEFIHIMTCISVGVKADAEGAVLNEVTLHDTKGSTRLGRAGYFSALYEKVQTEGLRYSDTLSRKSLNLNLSTAEYKYVYFFFPPIVGAEGGMTGGYADGDFELNFTFADNKTSTFPIPNDFNPIGDVSGSTIPISDTGLLPGSCYVIHLTYQTNKASDTPAATRTIPAREMQADGCSVHTPDES